jgi:outer membrane protein TolC
LRVVAGGLGRHLALVLPALLLTACAWQAYRPAPLDLAGADAVAQLNTLDDGSTRALLAAAGADLRAWPEVVWTRETLLIVLMERHPEMRAARARVAAARARVPAARQPVNPELSTRLENHSSRGSNGSPWAIGAGLQVALNRQPLRAAQGAVASAEAAEAEVVAGEVAWGLHRQLGDVLLAAQAAGEAANLAQDALALAQARAESAEVRQRYGAASALEVQLAREALLAARREQAQVGAAAAVAEAQLAQVLALPANALARVRLASWPVVPPVADSEGAGPDASTARAIALQNRLDLARELALYEVAEANVRLEITRQYPQVRLGPGLVWDQGDRFWQIGLSLPLALLQRNEAGIAAAEARRAAQAEQVLARQSAVAAEVELARQRVVALVGPLLASRTEAHAADERVTLVQRQFDAGAADAASLIAARTVALQARRLGQAATVAWRQAQWALEAALQAPLPAGGSPVGQADAAHADDRGRQADGQRPSGQPTNDARARRHPRT